MKNYFSLNNIFKYIFYLFVAANVNNQLSQLDRKLTKGDQVEIITSESQHPQEKWFEFLATATAKSRLKSGIKEYRRGFREEGASPANTR